MFQVLSLPQRAALLTRCLRDREAGVREACGRLLAAWLDTCCAGSLTGLLEALDPEAHTGEGRWL